MEKKDKCKKFIQHTWLLTLYYLHLQCLLIKLLKSDWLDEAKI